MGCRHRGSEKGPDGAPKTVPDIKSCEVPDKCCTPTHQWPGKTRQVSSQSFGR